MRTKLIIALVSILLVLGYTALVFHLGSNKGADEVQTKWDAENARRDLATAELKGKNAQLTTDNQRLTKQIDTNLEQSNERYSKAVAAVHAQYAVRLQQSTTRAGIYRQQAEGSTAERERLASHAAQLDRSIEEGRSVVQELRATLGLRDEQLKQLGEQIIADRALLN